MAKSDQLLSLTRDVGSISRRLESAERSQLVEDLRHLHKRYDEILESLSSSLQEQEQFASATDSLVSLAEGCFDFKENLQCKASPRIVEEILRKIRFLEGLPETDISAQVRRKFSQNKYLQFNWNNQNREAAKSWMRKNLCQANMDANALLALDSIDLYNTECYSQKDAVPTELQPFISSNVLCTNMDYIKIQGTGISYSTKRIRISGDMLFNARIKKGNSTEDASVRLLDHELTHFREEHDPKFADEVRNFLRLRFEKIRPLIDPEIKRVQNEASYRLAAIDSKYKVGELRTKEDREKIKQLFEWEDTQVANLLNRYKIPMRYDKGRDIDFILGAKNSYVDLRPPDEHSLHNNGDEYVAYAVEIYLHDPKLAVEVFAPEEIAWLVKHASWRSVQ